MKLASGRLIAPTVTGAGGLAGTRHSRVSLNITLPPPGKCPPHPVLVIALFDDSGSMWGGNDSAGLRYEEAALAIKTVGKKCKCGNERVAVLHMNRATSGDLNPTPISRTNWPTIEQALAMPADTDGASEMSATLARATQLANQHPDHAAYLLAFSDYQLVDDLHQLAGGLAAFPGSTRAVVMRAEPPAIFREFDQIEITHIPTGQTPGLLAETVFNALTDSRPTTRKARP